MIICLLAVASVLGIIYDLMADDVGQGLGRSALPLAIARIMFHVDGAMLYFRVRTPSDTPSGSCHSGVRRTC